MATIATVTGRLTLTIADGPPINLGLIDIPIEAKHVDGNTGRLLLTAKPNMREVRDAIEEIFGQSATQPDQPA